MQRIKSFYDLDLLKRNENRNNNIKLSMSSFISIDELVHYFCQGISRMGLHIISNFEINENEMDIIKKLSVNKNNKSVKDIEEKLILVIIENRNITLFDGYLKLFGDEKLFNIPKSKKKLEIRIKTFYNKLDFKYDKTIKTITECIFKNLSTKGLKYLIEINCCDLNNVSEFELVKNYSLTNDDVNNNDNDNNNNGNEKKKENEMEEVEEKIEKFFKFLKYYIGQNKIRLNDKYWFFKLFEIIINGLCKNSVEPIERFTSLLKQYGFTVKFPRDSNIIIIKDFNSYKWCINYFLKCGVGKDQILNHLPLSFKIANKEQVDFILDNIHCNHLMMDVYPSIMSVDLSLNYMDRLDSLRKLELLNERGAIERNEFLQRVLRYLHDTSIAECDFTTLEEISKLNLKFSEFEILPFKESITKEELLNLINHLNSIDFKSFIHTRTYGFFNQISELTFRFGINKQCKFSKSLNLTDVLFNAVGVLNYPIIDLILSDEDFRIDVKEYSKTKFYKFCYGGYSKTFFNKIDIKEEDKIIPPSFIVIEMVILKLLNSLQSHDIIQIQTLLESIYDYLLKESLHILPKFNRDNNNNNNSNNNNTYFIGEIIRCKLFERLQLINSEYQRHGIEITTSISRFTYWISLKSPSLEAFISKYQPFISSKLSPLSIHIINSFSFTMIKDLKECELFTRLRKLFLIYKSNNINCYFQFLGQYRLYDLMIQEIKLNFLPSSTSNKNKKKISSKVTLKNLTLMIQKLIECSISVEEFKKFEFKEYISENEFNQIIQKCIEFTIEYDNFELFKYFLSKYSHSNDGIKFFDYNPIIVGEKLDFLEYLLQNHLNLFLKLYSLKKFNFDQLIKENQFTSLQLLIKYLSIDFFSDYKEINIFKNNNKWF